MIRDLQPPIRMRRDLGKPFDVAVWPTGVHLRSFTTEHAAAVHDLLATAYTGGGGSVDAFPEWWASLATDVEFDPELLFVAWDTSLRIVGVAQCWTSAYIKDLAVRPDSRRQGLGRALVLHAFQVFKHRGALSVDLKVEANNPSGAVRLYQGLGMRQISA